MIGQLTLARRLRGNRRPQCATRPAVGVYASAVVAVLVAPHFAVGGFGGSMKGIVSRVVRVESSEK